MLYTIRCCSDPFAWLSCHLFVFGGIFSILMSSASCRLVALPAARLLLLVMLDESKAARCDIARRFAPFVMRLHRLYITCSAAIVMTNDYRRLR